MDGTAKGRASDTKRHRTNRPRRKHKAADRSHSNDGPLYLYGIHAIEAALNNPERVVHELKLTTNARERLARALRARAVSFETVTPKDLDHLLGPDCVHQGAALKTELLPEPTLDDLMARAGDGLPLLILDQVTDPHNLGAILRSAAVFGAAGLITTRRNSPPLAGTVAKTASGALEHIPVALVSNLARAMGQMNRAGVTIIGLDGEGDTLLQDADLRSPLAMVLGAEGPGLRRLTRKNCDQICAIHAPGPVQSLNVSNAAAICLHLAAMRRAQS